MSFVCSERRNACGFCASKVWGSPSSLPGQRIRGEQGSPLSVGALQLFNWGINAGNCNRSDRWLHTRIRCSRGAFSPKAPSGETTAASGLWGITFSGMTRFAQVARCAQPQPADYRQFRRVAALTLDKVSAEKKGPGLLKHGAL